MTKNIRNQTWIEYDTYIEMVLYEPFWSAYQMFKGFRDKEWGIGIAIEAINEAQKLGKKIRIKVIKYGTHEISPKKCLNYFDNRKRTSDHKVVLVIPHSVFKPIPTEANLDEIERKEDIRLRLNQKRQLELLST